MAMSESAPVIIQVGMVTPPDDTGDVPTTGEGTSGAETGAGEGTMTGGGTGTAGESGDSGETVAAEPGDEGCGCRSQSAPAAWWLLVLPVACRRRRDRRVA